MPQCPMLGQAEAATGAGTGVLPGQLRRKLRRISGRSQRWWSWWRLRTPGACWPGELCCCMSQGSLHLLWHVQRHAGFTSSAALSRTVLAGCNGHCQRRSLLHGDMFLSWQ